MERLGGYQLIEKIGRGGMGMIYRALHPQTKSVYAIKVKHQSRNPLCTKARFLYEAKVTKKLDHKGIANIYHIDQKEPFFVMDYLEGMSFQKIVLDTRQGYKDKKIDQSIGFDLVSLVQAFINIVEVVDFAYSKGFFHRDLKLENFFYANQRAYLLDWGLAKSVDSSIIDNAPITAEDDLAAFIDYMAPERLDGSPATVESEIYSLGVCLYYLLCLRPPFMRFNYKRFIKIIDKEFLIAPESRSSYRSIPESLSKIAVKCLEKEPQKRYLSYRALIDDLCCAIQEYQLTNKSVCS